MSNQVYKNKATKYDLANSGSVVYVYATNQSLANNVEVRASNWTLGADKDLGDAVSHAAGVFTINTDGVYHLQFNARYDSNATGSRLSSFQYTQLGGGGSSGRYSLVQNINSGVSDFVQQVCTFVMKMGKGDAFECNVFQNSGGLLDLRGAGADPRTNLIITRVG